MDSKQKIKKICSLLQSSEFDWKKFGEIITTDLPFVDSASIQEKFLNIVERSTQEVKFHSETKKLKKSLEK